MWILCSPSIVPCSIWKFCVSPRILGTRNQSLNCHYTGTQTFYSPTKHKICFCHLPPLLSHSKADQVLQLIIACNVSLIKNLHFSLIQLASPFISHISLPQESVHQRRCSHVVAHATAHPYSLFKTSRQRSRFNHKGLMWCHWWEDSWDRVRGWQGRYHRSKSKFLSEYALSLPTALFVV